MKGNSNFTEKEANEIKGYLKSLREVGRDAQKDIRAYLRSNLNFYISDFTSSTKGFTEDDFNILVSENKIIIK